MVEDPLKLPRSPVLVAIWNPFALDATDHPARKSTPVGTSSLGRFLRPRYIYIVSRKKVALDALVPAVIGS